MVGFYKIVPYLNGYAVKWRPKLWPFWSYQKEYRFGGRSVIKFDYIEHAKMHIDKDIERAKRRWKAINDAYDEKARKKRKCREIGTITDDNIST